MDITELRALLAKATQGEWEVEEGHIQRDSGGIRYWQITDRQDAITCNQFCYAGFDPERNAANAALIVAAKNSLPDLLDEIERLRAERDALREALEPFARAEHIVASMDGEWIRCILSYPYEARETFTLASLDAARAALKETPYDPRG